VLAVAGVVTNVPFFYKWASKIVEFGEKEGKPTRAGCSVIAGAFGA